MHKCIIAKCALPSRLKIPQAGGWGERKNLKDREIGVHHQNVAHQLTPLDTSTCLKDLP